MDQRNAILFKGLKDRKHTIEEHLIADLDYIIVLHRQLTNHPTFDMVEKIT